MRRYVLAPGLALVLALLAAACTGEEAAPAPTPTSTPVMAVPTATPSPVPTPTSTPVMAVPTATPSPTPTPGATAGETPGDTTPPPVEAVIVGFALPSLTVAVGTTVTWTNEDAAPHTTTSGQNGQFDGTGWNSPSLSTGQSFSYTFDTVGVFLYTCRIHPGMNSTVTVVTMVTEAPSQGSGVATSSDPNDPYYD